MGGGYVTRLLAAAVGPSGKVYGFQPAEFIAFKKQYGDDQTAVDTPYENVDALAVPFAAPAFPEPIHTTTPLNNFLLLTPTHTPHRKGDTATAAVVARPHP